MMVVEKNHLTKASSGIISLSAEELEEIATLFLSKMQMIYTAEPHQLCIEFFTWISPFTQESVSLPFHEEVDFRQTKFHTFNKFRREMTKSDKWSSLYGMFLNVLEEIAIKNNDKQD